MKQIRRCSYSNAELFKYENTRVQVVSLPSASYGLELKVLSDDTRPRAVHTLVKGKVVETRMKLSEEAALCLMIGLQVQLRKNGIIP